MFKKLRKVLLVDDDKITNFLNERLLKKIELTNSIEVAYNGQEALDLLEKEWNSGDPLPDMIFVDINMPVMDGIDFIKRFKEKFQANLKVLIVVLTTSTHKKDLDSLLKLGNSDYLNKPLNEQKLISIAEKYLSSDSMERMAG